MTVSKVPYFSWSSSGIDSTVNPYNSCSPNLLSIQDYCRRRWGVVSLGCHVPPPASTKSHPYGAANDLKFRSSTNFDRVATLEAIGFLIDNSAELGVNTIHDYYDHQRMWKPLVGWTYNASIGSPGGTWIHVETTPAAFSDGRPVEAKLTQYIPPPPPGGLIVTPEDKAYLETKFAEVCSRWADPTIEGWPTFETSNAVADTRVAVQDLPQHIAELSDKLDTLIAVLDPATIKAAIAEALVGVTIPIDNATVAAVVAQTFSDRLAD